MKTKRIKEVLESVSASFWLKDRIEELLERDAVDEAIDAEVLAQLFTERANLLLSEHEAFVRPMSCNEVGD